METISLHVGLGVVCVGSNSGGAAGIVCRVEEALNMKAFHKTRTCSHA